MILLQASDKEEHGALDFAVLPAGCQSCFGMIIPHHSPFFSIWTECIYSILLSIENM